MGRHRTGGHQPLPQILNTAQLPSTPTWAAPGETVGEDCFPQLFCPLGRPSPGIPSALSSDVPGL